MDKLPRTLNKDGDRIQISSTIHAETHYGRMLRVTWRKTKPLRWYHRLFGIAPGDDSQVIVFTKRDIEDLAAIKW